MNATYAYRGAFEAFAMDYIKQSTQSRIPLSEIRAAYNKPIPRSTATRTMQRLVMAGLIKIQRYEQLWVECNITSIRGTRCIHNLSCTNFTTLPPQWRQNGLSKFTLLQPTQRWTIGRAILSLFSGNKQGRHLLVSTW
jgi:hypothetical protein